MKHAITCLEAALSLRPANWSALWFIGKAQQRLGAPQEALEAFRRAYVINPTHPDVAREAAISATQVGDAPAAVRYARAAVALAPSDGGLLANLGLALLIAGDLEGAKRAADEACAPSPEDVISRQAQRLIDEVVTGQRPAPNSGAELGLVL